MRKILILILAFFSTTITNAQVKAVNSAGNAITDNLDDLIKMVMHVSYQSTGDVNNDGKVNGVDIVEFVNMTTVDITVKNVSPQAITIQPRFEFILNSEDGNAYKTKSAWGNVADAVVTIESGESHKFEKVKISQSRKLRGKKFYDSSKSNYYESNVLLFDENNGSKSYVADMIDPDTEFKEGGEYEIVFSRDLNPTPVDPTPVNPDPVPTPTPVSTFYLEGITYKIDENNTVSVKSVDVNYSGNVVIPSSVTYDGTDYQVTGIDNDAFKGCSLAALVWDVEAALPNNAFSNASIGSNFLLYVKSSSYAPSTVKNVVVNCMASSIQLSDDGGQFYCPQAFTTRNISYTHNYSMETGGNGKGWETIALPFDVQRIVHNTRGEIIPFAGYHSSSNQKPFWLAGLSASGFKRVSSIQAYEPYIIAMPNSSNYRNEYNLAGDVTFSADNVQIAKTPSFSGLFLPAFGTVSRSSTVYALNVSNRYVKYSGSYDAGSRFISNLRDVRPFEAYMTGSSSTRGVIEINLDDGMTDIDDILLSADEDQEVTIYTLSGQQVARTILRDFDQVWNRLHNGVYLVRSANGRMHGNNGQKIIK